MQRARGRRLVASLTAVLVAVSAAIVVLSAPPVAAAHRHTVRVGAKATAHATAHRTFRSTAHKVVRVTVTVTSRPARKGLPVGRATRTSEARATVTVRARARASAKATARASARKSTRKKAASWAHARAKRKAKAKAKKRAAASAHHKATTKARSKAKKRAKKRAHHRAVVKARHKARHAARIDRIDRHRPSTWLRHRPRHVTPPPGPRFNNPYAGWTKRRALLAQVIRAVKSSPGYRLTKDRRGKRLRCPRNPRRAPSSIKIAAYSIADKRFAKAVVAAHRRCVSVQVLMNSHLDATTSPSWGRIKRALGHRSKRHWRHQRSFAHRCSNGCLGTSVLHSKIYLFSHAGSARRTVMTGSTNMTRNAVNLQWNDLYTVNGNRRLYRQFRHMFRKMVPDRRARGPFVYRAGRYASVFYPFRNATRRTDRTMRSLDTIHCKGARRGTGIHGRTVVYIAMHAWFSKRGLYLAKRVRHLYNKGCYVRVLYSFLSHPAFHRLKHNTGHRMVVRRVLFGGPLGRATKYSHMKMYAASGHIGRDHTSRVVWTGSNNWVLKSLHADEVTLRIKSSKAYRAYVRHWKVMRRLRSSPTWAKFLEPEGGGRAP